MNMEVRRENERKTVRAAIGGAERNGRGNGRQARRGRGGEQARPGDNVIDMSIRIVANERRANRDGLT